MTLTFGKQKRVANKQLKDIDDKIRSFAKLSQKITNKNLDNLSGTGGVDFALATFLNAQLVSGAELILDTINFDTYLKNCEIVIVGEGKMDQRSLYGKIPITVVKRAKKYNVKKVIAIVGSYELDENHINTSVIDAVFSCILFYVGLESILKNASINIEQTATNIAKLLV